MRIIAGKAKGKILKAVPGTSTRPTSDKVKEAIFSIIGPYFDGGQVLDLFAGTGALGIEALSRGADHAVFIDTDRKSVEVIRHNVQSTGFSEQAEIYRNDATRAVKILARASKRFDLVLLDPPYRMKQMDEMVYFLMEANLLNPQALIVIEHAANVTCQLETAIWQLIRHSQYGDTCVTIYKEARKHASER